MRFRHKIMDMDCEDIFTRKGPVRGIVAIKNLKDDRIFLLETEDAVSSFSKERFALDLGIHKAEALQSDYSKTGLELFSIELDCEAPADADLPALLRERKEYWKEKGFTLY